jgi:hypothetical protein
LSWNEESLGRRKRRFSLRRNKVKWAEDSASALPIMMVGTNPPWSSLISGGWRSKGLSWNEESLGRRKRRFSLRRKKAKWAEGSASALPSWDIASGGRR